MYIFLSKQYRNSKIHNQQVVESYNRGTAKMYRKLKLTTLFSECARLLSIWCLYLLLKEIKTKNFQNQ